MTICTSGKIAVTCQFNIPTHCPFSYCIVKSIINSAPFTQASLNTRSRNYVNSHIEIVLNTKPSLFPACSFKFVPHEGIPRILFSRLVNMEVMRSVVS